MHSDRIIHRSLLDSINGNIVVLKPDYVFLMWKLPTRIISPNDAYNLFRDNYLEATRSIQRDLNVDKEIAEAWKNADDKVRKEYEKLCFLNKIPHPSTLPCIITTLIDRLDFCLINIPRLTARNVPRLRARNEYHNLTNNHRTGRP
ncbi:4260_t:CDS:2 [Funneliformis caledonium]|uniref:4260_t:CDS:1 n=1 Tax=Funneliformis caledonium TaxID=1117310 RepID=A0A9N8WCM6_9GLOM|nr:4260_t:CDS:2 [Funneliformis caledonium]